MRVCLLLDKGLEHDSRVRRHARELAEADHEVTVLYAGPPLRTEPEGFSARTISVRGEHAGGVRSILARARSFAHFVLGARCLRPDAIQANDAVMLPPAYVAARLAGASLIYDSHELATGVPYRSRPRAWTVALLEGWLIRRADAVVTVSDGIADRLTDRFQLRRRPAVVRNVPDPALDGADGGRNAVHDLRTLLSAPGAPLVLHQGVMMRERGCESLLRAAAQLPDPNVVFLGWGNDEYVAGLRRLANDLGITDRVHFVPPVPLRALLAHTRQADLGVALLENTRENHRLALPNKLFEYMVAEVPVVASALPEMGRVVQGLGVGWVVDPACPEELAATIDAGLARRWDPELRRRLTAAAFEIRREASEVRFSAVYETLGQSAPRVRPPLHEERNATLSKESIDSRPSPRDSKQRGAAASASATPAG